MWVTRRRFEALQASFEKVLQERADLQAQLRLTNCTIATQTTSLESRNEAIANGQRFVADVERHRIAHENTERQDRLNHTLAVIHNHRQASAQILPPGYGQQPWLQQGQPLHWHASGNAWWAQPPQVFPCYVGLQSAFERIDRENFLRGMGFVI